MTKFTLTKPIKDGDTEITEMTFRAPVTGDVAAAESFDGEFAQMIAVLALMADVSLSAFKQVSLPDFRKISELVAPMMGEYVEAGGPLS